MEHLIKDLIERIEALERRMEKIEKSIFFNDGDNENENYHPEGKHREAQSSSSLSLSLKGLMECKAPDGRYLMRHRYQWWAVYHVLVRQCGFPDGYREFVACIA